MSTSSYKRRRSNLMKKDPHCYWCKQLVIYFGMQRGQVMPQNFATLDHLNDRIDFDKRPKDKFSLVLACLKCNNERAREKIAVLGIERERERAGNPEDNWNNFHQKQNE